jgi:hypothetical protein
LLKTFVVEKLVILEIRGKISFRGGNFFLADGN